MKTKRVKVKAWAVIDKNDGKIWGYAAHFDIHSKRSACESIIAKSGHGKVVPVTVVYALPRGKRRKK